MTDPLQNELPPSSERTLDQNEVARFAAIADEWWDPNGKFRPLHALNPARLTFVRDQICTHFDLDSRDLKPFEGLKIIDIGCGGGLLCEPLSRLGAAVTGIDPAEDSINAARAHAEAQGLKIGYRADRVENLVADGERFDAVLALEVVEHVPDVPAFLGVAADLVRPGGLMLLSTINRTLKSYALAIVGAEFILRWLPVGTHRWDRFVTPAELSDACSQADLQEVSRKGLVFDPLEGSWRLSSDTDVNYLMSASRPG
ncbi:MAG: bifunctional 2-polyprenyl-6-hydroxyphenol methylase/3-demethylubiquinol 3-O-methyltransferase UbiG [Hyphomicrobiaceae bacterium]|nr:bifunctional 2-polyprenyl-6-hydroxyphenol methylase/3-demethylubiquinol 3-O-methyltransferase UbiG [Hyphomicrobiaceae bacterium]